MSGWEIKIEKKAAMTAALKIACDLQVDRFIIFIFFRHAFDPCFKTSQIGLGTCPKNSAFYHLFPQFATNNNNNKHNK
ncbi:MAG: hypothetical protein GY731_12050 [Gammaproteobacteria bacterium]|nr:hypothetical protein [Gammaproteobacteria bacterium]